MNRFFRTFGILLAFTSMSYPQIQDSYFQQTLYDDANHIFRAGSGLLKAPFNFNENDWQKTIYTISTTTALFFIDQNTKHYAQSNQTKINNDIFKIDDYFKGQTGMFAAAGLYSAGFLIKDNQIRRMGLHAMETIVIASSITGFLKYSFGRARPYISDDPYDFKIFRGSKEKYKALPSGHTTGAFAFASVMAMSVDNIYWKVFWYGSATMVGAARVYNNNHWISDTFLAGIISYSVAHYIVNLDVNRTQQQDTRTLKVQLYPYHMGAGIKILF